MAAITHRPERSLQLQPPIVDKSITLKIQFHIKIFVNLLVSWSRLKRWPTSWANVLPVELVERRPSCTTPTDALPHMVFKKAIPTVFCVRS